MKIDPYQHKEKYLAWKASINEKIPGISNENSKIIFNYLFDMEQGLVNEREGKKTHKVERLFSLVGKG